jgi:hypothetical protein
VASALHRLFSVYGLVTAFLLDHFDLLSQICIAHIKQSFNALGFLSPQGDACAAASRRFGNL